MAMRPMPRTSSPACLSPLQQMLPGPGSMQPWRIRLHMTFCSHSLAVNRSPSWCVNDRDRCLRAKAKQSTQRRACPNVEARWIVATGKGPRRDCWKWRMNCGQRKRKNCFHLFSRTVKDSARKNVWKKKRLFEIRVGHHMGQLRAEALAFFTSFWEQRGPLECRDICESLRGFYSVLATTWASWSGDTCESLSGFYLVLGTTWASWSRDTCESLSGFYLILGTTWVFPGGRKQFAYVIRRVWTALPTGKVHLQFDGRVRFQ